MANDEPINLVLERLRAIRGDIGEMKLRLDEFAGSQPGILKLLASYDERLLRMEGDIRLIKKRLDPVEAPAACLSL